MARTMVDGPDVGHTSLYGITYKVDLAACRAQMVQRVAEMRDIEPDKAGMQLVAEAAGVDRETLRRFFRGQKLSVETFTAIITRGLKLDLQEVTTREMAS